MTNQQDNWPAGATWVFQGTVQEDGTGGTHVCTLTVTPGAGSEMEVMYGQVLVGNTATAQLASARVTDGTNSLYSLFSLSGTTALLAYNFPDSSATGTSTGALGGGSAFDIIVSGTQQFILQVSTAAISVTQTFAVVCRIKGAKPTAVLADTVGAPVLTTNTNQVF